MKKRGFTLVELAIVLVIIALVLTGILNNQGLIGSANAKNVIAVVDDLRAATTYFKQRYNYLPGDWPYTAGEIAGISTATTVGTNGDGAIDGSINAQGQAQVGSEAEAVPLQLFNAGLIGKVDNNQAKPRIMTSYGTVNLVSSATADGLAPGFAAANPAVRNAIVFFNLPCDVASEVDNKLDDGNTATGRAVGTVCANNVILWYAVAL